jgi:RNA polymerase sigma-70 factor (ECF subfamily)
MTAAIADKKIFLLLSEIALIIKRFTRYTDQDLLRLICERDEQAFTALYERYYLALCKKAFQRVPSRPLVEEMVQDVFVNLWMKAAELDAAGNIRAYLYATLRNKVLHQIRMEYTRALYLKKITAEAREPRQAPGLQAIYARETEEYFAKTIDTLPPQCREAFMLSRFEELSYKEIAERMRLSVNTVEKHVGKALRILRMRMNSYFEVLLVLIMFSVLR